MSRILCEPVRPGQEDWSSRPRRTTEDSGLTPLQQQGPPMLCRRGSIYCSAPLGACIALLMEVSDRRGSLTGGSVPPVDASLAGWSGGGGGAAHVRPENSEPNSRCPAQTCGTPSPESSPKSKKWIAEAANGSVSSWLWRRECRCQTGGPWAWISPGPTQQTAAPP